MFLESIKEKNTGGIFGTVDSMSIISIDTGRFLYHWKIQNGKWISYLAAEHENEVAITTLN